MNRNGRHYVLCVTAHVCIVLPRNYKISDFTDVSYSGSVLMCGFSLKILLFGMCLLRMGSYDP